MGVFNAFYAPDNKIKTHNKLQTLGSYVSTISLTIKTV